MLTQLTQRLALATAFFSGSAALFAGEEPMPTTQSASAREPIGQNPLIKMARDIGTLDGLLKACDLLHKDDKPNSAESQGWVSRRAEIKELVDYAAKEVDNHPTDKQLRTLSVALRASISSLELYVDQRFKQNREALAPAERKTDEQSIVGIYDVADFEGFKTGVQLLLPLIKRQLNQSQLPLATQTRMLEAFSSINEARNPKDLNDKMRSMLEDPATTRELADVLAQFKSLGSDRRRDIESRAIEVRESALAWQEEWQKIVDLDKRPRLNPGGRAGHEQRSLARLAESENGLLQIKTSAQILANYFDNQADKELSQHLQLISAAKDSETLFRLSPHPLETLKRASARYQKEIK